MTSFDSKPKRHFTDAAREAAAAARKAKRDNPDPFGQPELFVVRVSNCGFAWELRRFGGVLLERSIEIFDSEDLARADGESVLTTLTSSLNLPTFTRQLQPK